MGRLSWLAFSGGDGAVAAVPLHLAGSVRRRPHRPGHPVTAESPSPTTGRTTASTSEQTRRSPPAAPARSAPAGSPARLGSDATLVDVLDRVLDRGVTITGDVVLSVAGVDLVHLGVRLVLKGIDGDEEVP